MSLSTNIARFHKEVFPKVRYDQMLEQYRINIGDYILLNLTKKQFRVLEKICQKHNIFIEKIPETLSVPESQILFEQLQELRIELEKNIDHTIQQKIEKQIQDIRNRIFEGNLKFVYIALYKNIPNLEESIYKEDILQTAYIYLLHHIDIYNPHMTNRSFRQFFWDYTATDIIKKAIQIQNKSTNEDYNIIMTAKRKLMCNETTSTELLSQSTGLRESRITELRTLERILNAEYLDDLTNEESNTPDLFDDTEEEQVHQRILSEYLMLILETLPNEKQKDIIIERYGLNGAEPKTFEQITTTLGISNIQRTQQIHVDALKNLQSQVRAKYIKELVEGYSQISLSEELEVKPIDEYSIDYEKIEKILIQQLPKEEFDELIMELDIRYRNVLLSYFEINGDNSTNHKNISQKLGITYRKYLELKQKGLFQLRNIIKYKYVIDNPNEDIKSVLDYLMYNYLHRGKTKTRKLNK